MQSRPTARTCFVDAITTPMLVIHGDHDYRVPIGEALRLWAELAERHGGDDGTMPHKFLYFPDENHWVLTPAARQGLVHHGARVPRHDRPRRTVVRAGRTPLTIRCGESADLGLIVRRKGRDHDGAHVSRCLSNRERAHVRILARDLVLPDRASAPVDGGGAACAWQPPSPDRSTDVFRQVVAYRWADGVSEDAKTGFRESLAGLRAIPELTSVKFADDAGHFEGNFDAVAVMDFPDFAAARRYVVDERHQAYIRDYASKLIGDRVVVQHDWAVRRPRRCSSRHAARLRRRPQRRVVHAGVRACSGGRRGRC